MRIWQFFRRYQLFFYFLVTILASHWSLLQSGLNFGHDLNHPARVFEMATGLREGNFPVIWSQNFLYGYGMPLFAFYAPLPYLFGAGFYLLGFSLTASVELMILVAGILTYAGGYCLGKHLFASKQAGVVVALLLTMAPYRAVDVMVRLAISEAYAIAFLPWILLGIVLVVQQVRYGGVLLAMAVAALLLAHNLSALIAIPLILCFGLLLAASQATAWKNFLVYIWRLLIAGLLGLGLAAFYFVPALHEKDFTQLDQFTLSSYFDFRQHFLYIRQFFEPWGAWEYGGSMWGPDDEMSFFLGWPALLVLVLASLQLSKSLWQDWRRSLQSKRLWGQLLLLLSLGAVLLLTLLKTQFIWELLPFARYIQFPWRLLMVAIVLIALLAATVWQNLSGRWRAYYLIALLVLSVGINTRYFQSEKYEDYSQLEVDYAQHIRAWHSNNLYDYVPQAITFFEKQGFYLYKKKGDALAHLPVPAENLLPEAYLRQLVPGSLLQKSTYKQFAVDLAEPATWYLHLAAYPGWEARLDGQVVPLVTNEFGLISLDLPAGQSQVEVYLTDTPVRRASKVVSGLSLAGWLYWLSRESTHHRSKFAQRGKSEKN